MRTITLIAILLIIAVTPAVSMMTIERIEGKYSPVWRTPEIPQALAELGNFPGRVYGERIFFSGIGDTERLYFAGDTKAFNEFLQQYSKLDYRPLKVTIMGGEPLPPQLLATQKDQTDCEGKPVQPTKVVYDWQFVRHLPWEKEQSETVSLMLWPGRLVDRSKIKVPKGVEVESNPGWEVEKLARIINGLSAEHSKVLTQEPVSADPKVGHVLRAADWRDTPFVTVYPVDQTARVNLSGLGDGYLLGVISLLTKADAPKSESSAAPGSYLLFYKTTGLFLGDEAGVNYVSLVSPSGEGSAQPYVEALRAPLLGHSPEKGCEKPCVKVLFPGRGEVSKNNPAWRVTIEMKWKEQMYRFVMDMEIAMT